MLGSIIGDIVGSAYEFSGYKSKTFTPLFHPKSRFTDDTVCTVGIAQALLDNADPATTLIAWCDRYAENGGWGRAFAQWFTASKPEPYGSWGNGGAMRVSPVGFLATSEEAVIAMSDAVTCITHNHPEAMASAQAVALTVYWAKRGVEAGEIQRRLVARFVLITRFTSPLTISARDTSEQNGRLNLSRRRSAVRCTPPTTRMRSVTPYPSGVTVTPLPPLRGVSRRPCLGYLRTSVLQRWVTYPWILERYFHACTRPEYGYDKSSNVYLQFRFIACALVPDFGLV